MLLQPKVFVLTMKAGNCGITLSAATRVYLLEPCIDPAHELQVKPTSIIHVGVCPLVACLIWFGLVLPLSLVLLLWFCPFLVFLVFLVASLPRRQADGWSAGV